MVFCRSKEPDAVDDAGNIPLKRGAYDGFSLMELIVVLTLVTVIAAVVVPLYGSSMAQVQLRDARNSFVSLITHVQERAVAESLEYRIYIDDKEGAYWVMRLAGMDKDEKVFKPVSGEFGRKMFFPPYLRVDRVRARKDRDRRAYYIACFPNGASDRATVSFRDERNRSRAFRVATQGAMGRIDVRSGTTQVVQ